MRSSEHSSRRKPYADPTGRFARVLERHEAQIARHTAIQSRIAGWQLFIGAATTAALIYIAYQQYVTTNRQVTLEYAKVAPQFAVRSFLYETKTSDAVTNSFPKDVTIRILRGEASLESVQVVQELDVARLVVPGSVHGNCLVRLTNYYKPKTGNITDFAAADVFRKIALEPSWFQDESFGDFLILEPQNTMVTIKYRDVFRDVKEKKFAGVNGTLNELPSGDFPESTTYETVNASLDGSLIRVPGSFKATKGEPVTKACRELFGLKGGKETFF